MVAGLKTLKCIPFLTDIAALLCAGLAWFPMNVVAGQDKGKAIMEEPDPGQSPLARRGAFFYSVQGG